MGTARGAAAGLPLSQSLPDHPFHQRRGDGRLSGYRGGLRPANPSRRDSSSKIADLHASCSPARQIVNINASDGGQPARGPRPHDITSQTRTLAALAWRFHEPTVTSGTRRWDFRPGRTLNMEANHEVRTRA